MSIAPVSTNSNTIPSPMGDNAIKLLEKQKMQLQEQIQKTNESKMEDKAKQEKIKQLQEQIQQIDMQIQQKRTEKLNPGQNQNTDRHSTAVNPPNAADSGDSIDSAGMYNLIQANATYSQAQILNNTKNSLMGKGNVLKIEIKQDEKRGGEAKTKRAELKDTEWKEQVLEKKVGEVVQTSQKQVKEAEKAESESKDVNTDSDKKENITSIDIRV